MADNRVMESINTNGRNEMASYFCAIKTTYNASVDPRHGEMIAAVTDPDESGTRFFTVMSASGPVQPYWHVSPLEVGSIAWVKRNYEAYDSFAILAEVKRINRKSVTFTDLGNGEALKVQVLL